MFYRLYHLSIVALVISFFTPAFKCGGLIAWRKPQKEISPVVTSRCACQWITRMNLTNWRKTLTRWLWPYKTLTKKSRQEDVETVYGGCGSWMRTPLTTINGLLEGLQYNAIPESQKEKAVTLMKNETERLIRLINEIWTTKNSYQSNLHRGQTPDTTETLRNRIDSVGEESRAAGDELIWLRKSQSRCTRTTIVQCKSWWILFKMLFSLPRMARLPLACKKVLAGDHRRNQRHRNWRDQRTAG